MIWWQNSFCYNFCLECTEIFYLYSFFFRQYFSNIKFFSIRHLRQNGLALGKLVLNISNAPPCNIVANGNSLNNDLSLEHNNLFAKRIASVLASLLPKYHDLPLTLSTLNDVFYFPRSNNDLDSGVLQVSQGTWFLVDESVLKEGKLCDTGMFIFKSYKSIRSES